MNRKLVSVVVALVAVFVVFLLIALIGPLINESLKLDNTAVLRFVFVAIGLLIVFGVYFFTRQNKRTNLKEAELRDFAWRLRQTHCEFNFDGLAERIFTDSRKLIEDGSEREYLVLKHRSEAHDPRSAPTESIVDRVVITRIRRPDGM